MRNNNTEFFVSATLDGGICFSKHKDAFAHYTNMDTKDGFKGVYVADASRGISVRGLNISGSFFDNRHRQLGRKALEVAKKHISE